jgi:hypothetical protein
LAVLYGDRLQIVDLVTGASREVAVGGEVIEYSPGGATYRVDSLVFRSSDDAYLFTTPVHFAFGVWGGFAGDFGFYGAYSNNDFGVFYMRGAGSKAGTEFMHPISMPIISSTTYTGYYWVDLKGLNLSFFGPSGPIVLDSSWSGPYGVAYYLPRLQTSANEVFAYGNRPGGFKLLRCNNNANNRVALQFPELVNLDQYGAAHRFETGDTWLFARSNGRLPTFRRVNLVNGSSRDVALSGAMILSLQYSANGSTVLSLPWAETPVTAWRSMTGEASYPASPGNADGKVAFSPDGTLYAVLPDALGGGSIFIYRTEDQSLAYTVGAVNQTYDICFTADSKSLVQVRGSTGGPFVTNLATNQTRQAGYTYVRHVRAGGSYLAIPGAVLDANTFGVVRALPTLGGGINSLAHDQADIDANGIYAGGAAGIVRISDGAVVAAPDQSQGAVSARACAISANGEYAALLLFRNSDSRGVIEIHHLPSATRVAKYDTEIGTRTDGWGDGSYAIDMSPDGSKFSYGRNDGIVCEAWTPTLRQLRFNVEREGWAGFIGPDVTIALRNSAGAVVQTVQTSFGEQRMPVKVSLPEGNYTMEISSPGTCRKIQPVTITGAAYDVAPNVSLAVGDIDGDNEVSVLDYIALSTSYDLTSDSPLWRTLNSTGTKPKDCDLDADANVSILDFILLSNSYGTIGD